MVHVLCAVLLVPRYSSVRLWAGARKSLCTGDSNATCACAAETVELRGRVSSSCRTVDATLSKLFAAVAAGKMPAGDLAAKLDKLDSLIAAEDNVPAADEFYESAKIESIPKFDDASAGNMTTDDVNDITSAPSASGQQQAAADLLS